MAAFSAIYVKVDGLEETFCGSPRQLGADTLAEAEDEALAIAHGYPGANMVDILAGGRKLHRIGFAL